MVTEPQPKDIFRHRTAIGRTHFSRPVRLAIESGLLSSKRSFFDYGCGRGQDLNRLTRIGFNANGWDPAYRAQRSKNPADVVNLGYVVNVIEDPQERVRALEEAWDLALQVLVVAARLDIDRKGLSAEDYADGCVTSRATFQKFFSQQELRDWVSTSLGAPTAPAAPGVLFVFRDEGMRQAYLASRYQRRRAAPRIRKADKVFEEHQDTLAPLVAFLSEHGRVPACHELENAEELRARVGTVRQAFLILKRVMGADAWNEVRRERADELLIYLAVEKLAGRPKLSDLPDALQLDIKEFFSSYKNAEEKADELLHRAGDHDERERAMRSSSVGKLTGNALYVHVDAVPDLPVVLRVYEACARQYVGEIEGGNVAKLNRAKPQVSYLSYPDFHRDPHPAVKQSLVVRLGNPRIIARDYSDSPNPGILHRKEEMLPQEHEHREKYSRLTRQEEAWGLYEHPELIGTWEGWRAILASKGVVHKGHRLVRSKREGSSGVG
ncbi:MULTISPECIES: DNA phosphorothioation-associated putative methyltransferase [unclassified Thioalkalivibrio]|uniref:DNA phosphorothioation-associated putative methyltransferase n=1 Tax=unclassified Thioalkalivibrio TaxID=2621013 RepID=UPI0003A586D0|nr:MULTISPECIES: DNA phosphorothioation-associated putative methyltransferase [unclassified Thioalkalivibrio]